MSTMVPTVPTVSGSMMTFSGNHFEAFNPNSPPPGIADISVALGRVCRFSGQGSRWWPVLLHSMAVADLLSNEVKIYGLLHDAAESVMGDVPRGFKTADYKDLEEHVMARILKSFGLPPMGPKTVSLVKFADDELLAAESWIVGPPRLGPMITPDRYPDTERTIMKYLDDFPPEECIRPDGLAIIEFRRRASVYLGWAG